MRELIFTKKKLDNKMLSFVVVFLAAILCIVATSCLVLNSAGAISSASLPSATSNGLTLSVASVENGDANQLTIEPPPSKPLRL